GGMALGDFLRKQFIDVLQWTEPEDGILAYRFPMQDMEIQTGAKLTVRESQMAAFVNEGKMADVFGPGLYTLSTKTLPVLTNLMNWDKMFQSPFKSDIYFYSTRIQTNQRWGTQTPITIRDKDFGAVRLRANGLYSYHLSDPAAVHQKAAESLPIAAANSGSGAGLGVGLGAGMAMGKQMMDAMTPSAGEAPATPSAEMAFCPECGKQIPRASKFCPECGAKRS